MSDYKVCVCVIRFSDPRPFENALEINSELRRAKLLFPGELTKPEAFVRDREGEELASVGHVTFM